MKAHVIFDTWWPNLQRSTALAFDFNNNNIA